MLPAILNAGNKKSLNSYFRKKRFALFLKLTENLPKPLKILDIGGTEKFWENMEFTDPALIEATLLNLNKEPVKHSNFQSLVGDARNLKEYEDQSFDLVFSNSVIEHLFTFDDQRKMAEEIRRVGKNYFVQTPNKYFPLEPHWLFPFFQFFPFKLKFFLTTTFALGNYPRFNKEQARQTINEVRLLSASEMKSLFPDGKIYRELFLGLTKSIIMCRFQKN